jgi:hypothetical protein
MIQVKISICGPCDPGTFLYHGGFLKTFLHLALSSLITRFLDGISVIIIVVDHIALDIFKDLYKLVCCMLALYCQVC